MSSSHKRTRCLKLFVNHITSMGTLNHNTGIHYWSWRYGEIELVFFKWLSKLQEFVWFNLCYYLGRRGREGWCELTKNLLEFKYDNQDNEYVTIKHTEQTKNNQGGSKQKDQDYTDVRMYGIPGSSMDPISSLKLMLSKLHPDCEALFQTPLTKFSKAAECWYKNEPLGKNSIAQLMPKISKKAGLSQVYTAHCVRASTITSLHQAGVDAKQICAITKHKNEQSLTSYIKDSSASQKRACSNILSRPFLSRETSDVNTACSSSMAGGEVHVSFAALSQTPSVQPIMPNCQFTNCTINFNT